MDDNQRFLYYAAAQSEEEMIDVMRKGPWTMEEDLKLTNCIAIHGPGQWSYLARSAGLNRTGKSCRLRWLNYLHPDVKRGNLTLEEQLVILELHSRWGNRWSKIAEHLPGRTDNEVKNYWRTRVQKLAKQLKCDVNSSQFRDTMRHLWLPTLVERVRAESAIAQVPTSSTTTPSGRVLQTGIALAVSKSKSEISTASSSETPPEVQVSPASDLTYHDDFPGSNWYFQQEGPITGLSTACSISYCEQEEGFESQILEENNNGWLGGGCGDSLDYLLSKDYSWLIHDQASYHD